jgi:hypothetical protein
LTSGAVLYIHDGSENHTDHCSFQALPSVNDTWHVPSEVKELTIAIQPVNNKPPVLIHNEVLVIWMDAITELTNKELLFTDEDTPPSQIVYETVPARGGHLALRSNPKNIITIFTQQQIDENEIVFVQEDDGSSRTGFSFQGKIMLNQI